MLIAAALLLGLDAQQIRFVDTIEQCLEVARKMPPLMTSAGVIASIGCVPAPGDA